MIQFTSFSTTADRSQDKSSINSGGSDTQNVHGDQNDSGNDDHGDEGEDETANDAKDIKIKTLIENFRNSIRR